MMAAINCAFGSSFAAVAVSMVSAKLSDCCRPSTTVAAVTGVLRKKRDLAMESWLVVAGHLGG